MIASIPESIFCLEVRLGGQCWGVAGVPHSSESYLNLFGLPRSYHFVACRCFCCFGFRVGGLDRYRAVNTVPLCSLVSPAFLEHDSDFGDPPPNPALLLDAAKVRLPHADPG